MSFNITFFNNHLAQIFRFCYPVYVYGLDLQMALKQKKQKIKHNMGRLRLREKKNSIGKFAS